MASSNVYLAHIMTATLCVVVGVLAATARAWSTAQLPSASREHLVSPRTFAAAVVAKDRSGNYTTIAAAVAAARRPRRQQHGRYVIYIKQGVYIENVVVSTAGVMLVGDGLGKTVISGKRSNRSGIAMPDTATLLVKGDWFVARDLSIQNTAGASENQAVALRVDAKQSVFYRCGIHGFQDTLYAQSGRQFYRECQISGTIDIVFGNAKAVFQNCQLLVRRPSSRSHNVITAQGRDGPDHRSGFSFQNCTVKAFEDLAGVDTYLGRPWRNHSHVVFMQCFLDRIVHPSGWEPWKKGQAVPNTIFYGEYDNTGPGASLSQRIMSHTMDAAGAAAYTVEQFIRGNEWLPGTGVEYKPGL